MSRTMNATLIVLLLLSAVLWAALLGALRWVQSGDPLSRRIAAPLGIYVLIGLWALLAVALVISMLRTGMSLRMTVGALGLLALSFAAGCITLQLFEEHAAPGWLALVTALPPLLFGSFAVSALSPSWQRVWSLTAIQLWVVALLLVLAGVPWPFAVGHAQRNAEESARLGAARATKP